MSILDRFKKKNEGLEKASLAKQVSRTEKKEEKAEKKPAKTKRAAKAASAKSLSRMATAVLLAPVSSEKTAGLSQRGILVFRVPEKANKNHVREAFRELYKVTPKRVNMVRIRGKATRFGRVAGRRSNIKKAIITLPEGARVDIFEGV